MGIPNVIIEKGQRREFSRVDAYIPFEYRIIAPEEKDHIRARIYGTTSQAEFKQINDMDGHDNIIEEWMKILDQKLDAVIRLLTLQREGYFGLSYRAVNISGGGLSFCLPQAIPLGVILEIKIVFTLNRYTALCIYGETVKMESENNHYLNAVQYVHMDEHVRNEIIRFVFEREREIIREKRG